MRQTLPLQAAAAMASILLLTAMGIGQALQPIVINELVYDDTSTDDREFVELFNPNPFAVDLSSWQLEGGDTGGPDNVYTLPASTIIPAGGYLVAGSANVPGVNVVLTGPSGGLFQNDNDYLALKDTGGSVIDVFGYETSKGALPLQEGNGWWGNTTSVDASPMSQSRWRDGYDTNNNGADFGLLPMTPGAANVWTAPLPKNEGFEGYNPGDAYASMPGSYVAATVIDPTVASTMNPNVIPASPGGGNALIVWDPSGGGDYAVLASTPYENWEFSAWVYFDANPEAGTEVEQWSIGARGTGDTFYNLGDSNGDTGITWTYRADASGGWLSLIDHGHGGNLASQNVLGSIGIVAGTNDGWQRLSLSVNGDQVQGTFGQGLTEVSYNGSTSTLGLGTFYVGYREAVVNNLGARPPTIDNLTAIPEPGTLALGLVALAAGAVAARRRRRS